MDDSQQMQGYPLVSVAQDRDPDDAASSRLELVALAASEAFLFDLASPRHATPRPFDLTDALAKLGRLLDTVETLQLQCSVLRAEKLETQHVSDTTIQGAFDRISELEEVVSGLMRLVSKYDALLAEANARSQDAEDRAFLAELKIKDAERGTSDAVDWLYRYVAEQPPYPP